MDTNTEKRSRRSAAGAWILAGVALLVGVDLGAHLGGAGATNVAHAQVSGGVVNPADQRNQMISELRKMSERMDKLARHIDQAHRDVAQVNVSARKISSRFETIEQVEMEGETVPALEQRDDTDTAEDATGSG